MGKKFLTLTLVISFAAAGIGAPLSWARPFFGPPPEGTPSVFYYAWRGLALGALGGLAAGYIRYGEENDNTNNILMSAGYGSIAGAGTGLVIGLADAGSGKTGIGGVILRDMHLGGLLGLTLGTIVGGIEGLNAKDWRPVGRGAAWGYLGGLVVGLGVALIEGPLVLEEAYQRPVFHSNLAFYSDSEGNTCPGWKLKYDF